jgi:hypothetical protein
VLSDRTLRSDYDARRSRRRGSAPDTSPQLQPEKDESPRSSRAQGCRADVVATLVILPEEAIGGGVCEFVARFSESCRACQGTARQRGIRCPTCHGVGTVRVARMMRVVLPRGMRQGTLLRIPGVRYFPEQPPGDLTLQIRINPNG